MGCGVSLHVARPLTAHIPRRQHHFARPRSAGTHPKWYPQKQEARILSESGPLKTELGGSA
jgi:hypothetical protein